MDSVETKYTRVEYERRFLVAPISNWKSFIEPHTKRLQDKYLRNTKLRLRQVTDSRTGRTLIKLNKKFDSDSPYFQTISRILLSINEYNLLAKIDGDQLNKTRYYHNYLGQMFAIDVFEGELEGLVLCETEAENLDELMSVELPSYVKKEVTEDLFFTGGNLCRTTWSELMVQLSKHD